MKQSRVKQFDHKVKIEPIPDTEALYVHWYSSNSKLKHTYLIANSIEDFDILITEMGNALNNYVRKKKLGI